MLLSHMLLQQYLQNFVAWDTFGILESYNGYAHKMAAIPYLPASSCISGDFLRCSKIPENYLMVITCQMTAVAITTTNY